MPARCGRPILPKHYLTAGNKAEHRVDKVEKKGENKDLLYNCFILSQGRLPQQNPTSHVFGVEKYNLRRKIKYPAVSC